MRTEILGVGFDDLTMDEAVKRALELMGERGCEYVVTPNPEIVWLCRRDGELRGAVKNASLVLADGIGVVYASKILGRPLKQKLPGIDFASALMSEMAGRGMSVFLFGAKPGVAELAGERLRAEHPGLVIAGAHNGYFVDDGPIIDMINAAAPDLLLVCLGAPKQELWMRRGAGGLNAGLMAGLGGSLDVFAGVAERAPEGWRRAGLEWLYRLLREPRRIGRMIKLPLFLIAVVGQRLKGGKARV